MLGIVNAWDPTPADLCVKLATVFPPFSERPKIYCVLRSNDKSGNIALPFDPEV